MGRAEVFPFLFGAAVGFLVMVLVIHPHTFMGYLYVSPNDPNFGFFIPIEKEGEIYRLDDGEYYVTELQKTPIIFYHARNNPKVGVSHPQYLAEVPPVLNVSAYIVIDGKNHTAVVQYTLTNLTAFKHLNPKPCWGAKLIMNRFPMDAGRYFVSPLILFFIPSAGLVAATMCSGRMAPICAMLVGLGTAVVLMIVLFYPW